MKRLLLLLCLLAVAPAAWAQTPDALFQQALRMERVQGDFRGAIGIYEQVIQAPAADRATVAKALVNMGKAYESLGRTEAFSIYERVVRDFSDQAGEVAEARERMAGLAAEPDVIPQDSRSSITMPLFVRENGLPAASMYGAAPSASGRYVVRMTGKDAEVAVSDLKTGDQEFYQFGELGCDGSFITGRISPDDKTLAVSCWESVYLIDRETKEVTRLFEGADFLGISEELHFEAEVYDWTDDGDYVLASVQGWECCNGDPHAPNARHWVALVPVAGGDPVLFDSRYWAEDRDFREMNACIMNDASVMYGEYTVEEGDGADTKERIQIRALTAGHEKEWVVLGDPLYDYELYGCDRDRSVLYYSRNTRERRQLWASDVNGDGNLSNPRFIENLPPDSDPILSTNGDLYYTHSLGGEWMAVEASIDEDGALAGEPSITGEFWFVHRYAPNGAYIAEEDPSGLSYFGTPSGVHIPLLFTEGYAAQVRAGTGNHFIFHRWDEDDPATLILSADDGVLVDSIPGVWANWVTPDLATIYRMEQREDAPPCLAKEDRATGDVAILFCGERERGFQTEFDPESGQMAVWGRQQGPFMIEYYDEATDSFTDAIPWQGRGGAQVRWAGGKLYYKKSVEPYLARWTPESEELESLPVLQQMLDRRISNSSNQFGLKLDGSSFQTHYHIHPPGDTFELFVIRNPLASN